VSKDTPKRPRKRSKEIAFSRLIELANAGKPRALRLLRRVLDEHPEIWQEAGDLALLAQRQLMQAAVGKNQFARESLERKIEELKVELVGTSPSRIEELAAERVTATWLQVHHLDLLAASYPDQSTPQAKAVSKRQDQAHRRYMQALKSLGTLRRFIPSMPGSPDERKQRVRVCPSTTDESARRTRTA